MYSQQTACLYYFCHSLACALLFAIISLRFYSVVSYLADAIRVQGDLRRDAKAGKGKASKIERGGAAKGAWTKEGGRLQHRRVEKPGGEARKKRMRMIPPSKKSG